MTTTRAQAVAIVSAALDAKLTADDLYLQAVLILGQASTDGVDIKAVHSDLDKAGYGDMLKLTRCYAMAFAGQLFQLPNGTNDEGKVVEFKISERTVVSTMLRAYNLKGGAAAIRRMLRKAGATRQSAYAEIDKFSHAPKDGKVEESATDTSVKVDPAGADVDAMITAMNSILGGLVKHEGTATQHAAAVALASRLAVWGGIPAQVVHAA